MRLIAQAMIRAAFQPGLIEEPASGNYITDNRYSSGKEEA